MSVIRSTLLLTALGAPALAQSDLLTFHGEAGGQRLGDAVAGGRDVDGDGHPDLVLGAYADSATAPEQGSVRVVSGWTGAEIHRFHGSGRDWLGFAVCLAGDLDGDGRADVVAGATQAFLGGDPPGYVRAWSGATGSVLWTQTGPSAYSLFGYSLAALDDLDGDGRPEIAVGARDAALQGQESGAVYICSGASGAVLNIIPGLSAGAWCGWSVADAGDVNGDGTRDLAVGLPGWDEPGLNDVGAVELRALPSGALLRRILGAAANESFGLSVSGGADLDGDGQLDVCAGSTQAAYQGTPIAGVVRVHSCATGALVRELGLATTFANCGQSCAVVGDVDGDGLDDVAVGCPGQPASWTCGGQVGVWSVGSGALLRSRCGAALEDGLGRAVAPAGDVNGDGFADWLVGAPWTDVNGSQCGTVLVASGWDCPAPSTYCAGLPNSVGAGARIGWSGSASVHWNTLRLSCSGLPPGSNGRFFLGTTQLQQIFGDGYRCVGGATVRLPVLAIGAGGDVEQLLDAQALAQAGVLAPGSVRYAQFWYRNQLPGGAGFNLSDGLSVTFCP